MLRARRTVRCVPWGVLVAMTLAGCGGASASSAGMYVVDLNRAIREPVADPEQNSAHSRLVEQVVDARALDGLSRVEVRSRIGEGEPCYFYDRCHALGFDDDDWFYTVGTPVEGFDGTLPVLLVGFDRFGVVSHVWHLRVH